MHATLADLCRFGPRRELDSRRMAEAQAVAVAESLGVKFKISLEQRIAGAGAVGTLKTGMLQDVPACRAPGLEALPGTVTELGRSTGTATLAIEAVYAAARLLTRTLQLQHGKLAMQRA